MEALRSLKSYRGRRVLVTGHTGFKGSWLTLWLKRLGAKVCGVALAPDTKPSLFLAAKAGEGIRDERFDICDEGKMKKVFSSFKPEVVFHLAAQPIVTLSYKKPFETFETNVFGSLNLLERVKESSSVRSLVYVTSDKCYKNIGTLSGYREEDALGGEDPYSASKAAAEIVFLTYLASFFKHRPTLGAASARSGNVIGGGDWAKDRVVVDAVRCLVAGRSIFVRNPDAIRPWQHVLDPVAAYLILGAQLLKKPRAYEGSWNFGPSAKNPAKVRALVEEILKHWGEGKWHHEPGVKAVAEARILTLNCDKARKHLKWKSVWGFEASVQKTIDWYRDYYDGKPARALCLRDIEAYLKRTKVSL